MLQKPLPDRPKDAQEALIWYFWATWEPPRDFRTLPLVLFSQMSLFFFRFPHIFSSLFVFFLSLFRSCSYPFLSLQTHRSPDPSDPQTPQIPRPLRPTDPSDPQTSQTHRPTDPSEPQTHRPPDPQTHRPPDPSDPQTHRPPDPQTAEKGRRNAQSA